MEELDRIYEAAVADDLEEQNRQEKDKFPQWDEATKKIAEAEKALAKAVGLLSDSGELIEGSSEEDRIFSLSDEAERLWKDVQKQIERM